MQDTPPRPLAPSNVETVLNAIAGLSDSLYRYSVKLRRGESATDPALQRELVRLALLIASASADGLFVLRGGRAVQPEYVLKGGNLRLIHSRQAL